MVESSLGQSGPVGTGLLDWGSKDLLLQACPLAWRTRTEETPCGVTFVIQPAHTLGRGSGYFGPPSVIFYPLIPQQPQLLLWGGDSAQPFLVPLEITYSFVHQFV